MPVFIILIIIYVVLIILTRKCDIREFQFAGRWMSPFYQAAAGIRRSISGKGRKRKWPVPDIFQKRVRNDLTYMYPTEALSWQEERYNIEKLGKALTIGFIGCVLGLCIAVSNHFRQILTEDNAVVRNGLGGGDKAVTLIAEVGEEKQEFCLQVHARRYTETEFLEVCDTLAPEILQYALGENRSPLYVVYDLRLVDEYEDYPFELVWDYGVTGYLMPNGELVADAIGEDGVSLKLGLIIRYGEYEKRYYTNLCLYPPDVTTGNYMQRLQEAIILQEQLQAENEQFILPAELEGQRIIWKEKKKTNVIAICFVIVVLVIGCGFLTDYELHRKVKRRREELLLNYPEMISRLCMYLGAGDGMREAWRKTTDGSKKDSVLREEMTVTLREMDDGISETEAYARFGKRCRLSQYIRFGTLVTQNLRKGSSHLLQLLYEESQSVFEERKKLARRKGEELGTKLLLPMMLLLGVVMVIIMAPAFYGLY